MGGTDALYLLNNIVSETPGGCGRIATEFNSQEGCSLFYHDSVICGTFCIDTSDVLGAEAHPWSGRTLGAFLPDESGLPVYVARFGPSALYYREFSCPVAAGTERPLISSHSQRSFSGSASTAPCHDRGSGQSPYGPQVLKGPTDSESSGPALKDTRVSTPSLVGHTQVFERRRIGAAQRAM